MAMAVSRNRTFALTVSADHLIGRYDLLVRGVMPSVSVSCARGLTSVQQTEGSEDISTTCSATRMKNPGNGSLAIRDDGRVCAVGGWDGK